jgi:hypothetical protein
LIANPECANQTLNFDKTPLHLLAAVLNDTNLPKVFEIIRVFSEYNGDFSWPARKNGNQTPFSMLLEKMASLKDKVVCLKIIRFLISNYSRIDMFQREKCAEIIRKNFEELIDEYQVIENWKEETYNNMDWKSELAKLIVENEAEFLVKFDIQKRKNRKELEDYVKQKVLFNLAIRHDKYESFVEIYEMRPIDHFTFDYVPERVLEFNRCRMLKYFLDHDNVISIDPNWMTTILWQMDDIQVEMNPDTQRCFHILLDHPKYDVNGKISGSNKMTTALHIAATRSEYATKELLRKGATLGMTNEKGQMAIQFIDSNNLKHYFDSCITTCIPEDRSDNDYFMVIDYSFLKADKEMPLIEYMTKSKELQPLFEHPVIASFLFLKWMRLSSIFYLNLLLSFISSLSFSFYLMMIYVSQDDWNSTHHGWFSFLKISAYMSVIMFASKEMFQFVASPTGYLKSFENYFELVVISLMMVAVFMPIENQHIRRSIAALLYLGLATVCTLMLGDLPIFSRFNYNVILRKVAFSILRTLAFYSIVLMAFALCFETLLYKSDRCTENDTANGSNGTEASNISIELKLYSMFSTIFYMLLMLTGEFATLSTNSITENIIGRILMLVFLFTMTIPLMNLLIGLTVSDTAAIEREAEWNTWWERAKLLGKYESMTENW